LSITRSEAREQAFILLFSITFNDYGIDEIISLANLTRDYTPADFTLALSSGAYEKLEDIDALIEKYSENWNKNRISKISITILRLAIYEILHVKDIPISVSINEAVELAKKYATVDDSSFINGILGNLVRTMELSD